MHRQVPQTAWGVLILNFIPSWFSVNMGTGIVSVLLKSSPHQFPGLQYIAVVFYVLNIVLFLLFTAASIARYIMYPWVTVRMLKHPSVCMFWGTVPMGLVTIINATILIAVPMFGYWVVVLVQVLWWFDILLTLLSSFAIPVLMFHIHQLALESMTAAWLLPLVPTVVVAASGGLLATVLSPDTAMIVLVVSYMLWGVGMGLSFMVMALYFHRLAIYNLPTAEVIVTAFLPLGPLGQGAFGLVQLAKAGQPVFSAMDFAGSKDASSIILTVSVLVATMMWGLGFWWLLHGVISVLLRFFNGGLKFNMGFWGFIFPLGVYTAATGALAETLPSVFLSWLTVFFIVLLVVLWLGVAYGTVFNAVNGKLFVAPCLTTAPSKDPDLSIASQQTM